MSEYIAIAKASRSKKSMLCMQNFSIFKYKNDTYMIASGYKGDPQRVKLQLLKYVSDNKNNKMFSFKVNENGNTIYKTIDLCYGHGNSIEVIMYKNIYYCLYVEQTEEKKAKYVACSKFTITDDVGKGYVLNLETPTRLTLFPDYKDTPINECILAASESHICVSCSYGATLRTDTERYHIYKKNAFMELLATGNRTQASLNSCRVATGMFADSNSIGLNIPKNKAVVQSLGLGEDLEAKRVTIFGAIDDRTIGNDKGRKIHQINRACLDLKTAGSEAALKAQNPASVRCYYSPVDKLKCEGKIINMNYVSPKPHPSVPTDEVKMRFELEGIKKIINSGTDDIPNGWYISVYNSYLSSLQNPTEDMNPKPVPTGIEATLWNQQIYDPTTTPTTAWKPST